MQIINADPTRMIDLPGVGPCPRPVEIDQSMTGFTRLKSLRIYRFQPGVTINGDSEVDEVYIVPFGGRVDMNITGTTPVQARLSAASAPRALYMAPDHSYQLTPVTESLVAYARAAATGRVPCHAVQGRGDANAEFLSFTIADLAAGDAMPTDGAKSRLVHIIAGSIVIEGQPVTETQTAALSSGQSGLVQASSPTTLLMVSA